MNTPESRVIYLLNRLVTSLLRHITNYDSVTLVYVLKLTVLSLKINFR